MPYQSTQSHFFSRKQKLRSEDSVTQNQSITSIDGCFVVDDLEPCEPLRVVFEFRAYIYSVLLGEVKTKVDCAALETEADGHDVVIAR
mmetsp:Transcript_41026/g.80478  ORF Transcript_41026/g.80478 Transcript_41026/m.80478 type:complete len:88 (-) Transcript_41026:425-688(-)